MQKIPPTQSDALKKAIRAASHGTHSPITIIAGNGNHVNVTGGTVININGSCGRLLTYLQKILQSVA